ncbi:lantibiotic dehydratase [Nocardia pseudobrasiliensis]|uniref:Lantibiotic biosynthesis dehydratase-like protein n=1 Tax=Nocardia pseudobrasiliensis TaxID=45979 RepID=A0A370I6X0_9NOCA|nr:lantibiotic dehydratase [Nocardia pseudobrasiliensis]RDI66473.1 lantibiotic biosynthesis dehydratase-like protein [Nocardia pseudobrasiliensis]
MSVKLPSGAHLTAPLVIRIAGLPSSRLHRLRFESTAAQVDAVVLLTDWLGREGEQISEALYPVVGHLTGSRKARVVGLRRTIFQCRLPSPREWDGDTTACLPDPLVERIEYWLSERRRLDELRAALPATLAAEARDTLEALRACVDDPMFLRALSQSSPALFDELAKWLAGGRAPKQRVVLQLVRYLSRAVAKTSPYSTYTVSGFGGWSHDGPAVVFTAGRPAVSGRTELNGLVVQQIIRNLCQRPPLSDALAIRLNPSLTRVDGTVLFLGPPPDESLMMVPENDLVRRCLDAFDDHMSLPTPVFRDHLARGCADPADAWRQLRELLRAGLVEQLLPVPDLCPDPLRALADWLGRYGGESADIAALAARVDADIRAPRPIDDIAGHRDYRGALFDRLRTLGARAGVAVEDAKSIVCDNAVFDDPVVEARCDAWRPALADLDVVRSLLPVLDPAVPLRLILAAFFEQRWPSGNTVPLLVFHRAVAQALAAARGGGDPLAREMRAVIGVQASPIPILATSSVPRVRALGAIQTDIRAAFRLSPSDANVHGARAEEIERLLSGLPAWAARSPSSIGCYVQLISDADPVRLVINAVHGGHGRSRARVQAVAGQQAPGDTPIGLIAHSDITLAELGGLFGFTPNNREPSVVREIDYPFTVSRRPESERIPLGDLVVRLDGETGLLTLARQSGEPVHPLHLGMLADGLLPPAARLLIQTFGESYYIHPSQPVLIAPEEMVIPAGVLRRPRLELGRVVLQRARWVVPEALIPVRPAGMSDSDYLIEIVGWLRAHGIPSTCFVRKWSNGLRNTADRITEWVADSSRKPVYVDFANFYLTSIFERMMRAPGPVVIFEEALPEVGDSPGPDRADPAVVEFLIELSGQEITYGN